MVGFVICVLVLGFFDFVMVVCIMFGLLIELGCFV